MKLVAIVFLILFLCLLFRREAFSVQNEPFDVYVINLDRAKDRLEHFKKTYKASDLGRKVGFIRFNAVNGNNLDMKSILSPKAFIELQEAERNGYRTKHYQITRGAVGCYMSHINLYKQIMETDKEYALIFEDDAILDKKFLEKASAHEFPEDWDMLLFGYYCLKCNKSEGYVKVRRFYGLHGYAIHKRGIEKVLRYSRTFPVEKQVDAVLAEMAEQGFLNVYASKQKLATQNNKDFKTSIQIPFKHRYGVDPYAKV